MTLKELRAYREKLAADFARRSTAESLVIADREKSNRLMVGRNYRVRLAPVTDRGTVKLGVAKSEVRDNSWSGVPRDIPAMRRDRPRKYRDPKYRPAPQAIREPVDNFSDSRPLFVAEVRATDVKGKSERFYGLRKPWRV